MITTILWLTPSRPVLALAISAVAYVELFCRRKVVLEQRFSQEAEEHRKNEERYRLLMEKAPDAIVPREGRAGK